MSGMWDDAIIRRLLALYTHDHERRDEEVAITAPPKNILLLETGEKREGVNLSCRIFFVYVTPTGAEVPITRCPALSKNWTKATGGFEGDTRLVTSEYVVISPTTLKMVNIVSAMGSPKKVINLFIHLSPDEPLINLHGLHKFGKFRGRGKIDYDESTFREPTKMLKVSLPLLKDEFGLSLISPGVKAGGSRARSLIFD